MMQDDEIEQKLKIYDEAIDFLKNKAEAVEALIP